MQSFILCLPPFDTKKYNVSNPPTASIVKDELLRHKYVELDTFNYGEETLMLCQDETIALASQAFMKRSVENYAQIES